MLTTLVWNDGTTYWQAPFRTEGSRLIQIEDGQPMGRVTAKRAGNCAHLGAATGETTPCTACKATVSLKVFQCALHHRCTRSASALRSCSNCADWVESIVDRSAIDTTETERGTVHFP